MVEPEAPAKVLHLTAAERPDRRARGPVADSETAGSSRALLGLGKSRRSFVRG